MPDIKIDDDDDDMKADKQVRFFDSRAKIYDETREVSPELLARMIQHLETRGFLDANSGARILEIGCGTGRIACSFSSRGHLVLGIDLAFNMLNQAIHKRSLGSCYYFHPILADGEVIPIPSNTMDLSYTIHVLHLIPRWQLVVTEAIRCSKKKFYMNGRIFRNHEELPFWKAYWRYLKEHHDVHPASPIGAKSEEEVTTFLANQSFDCTKITDQVEILVNRNKAIRILEMKAYSSQRHVPSALHEKALTYLKDNNYFVSATSETFKISEKIMLWVYFPR